MNSWPIKARFETGLMSLSFFTVVEREIVYDDLKKKNNGEGTNCAELKHNSCMFIPSIKDACQCTNYYTNNKSSHSISIEMILY